jgi:hypothetical protein
MRTNYYDTLQCTNDLQEQPFTLKPTNFHLHRKHKRSMVLAVAVGDSVSFIRDVIQSLRSTAVEYTQACRHAQIKYPPPAGKNYITVWGGGGGLWEWRNMKFTGYA